MAKTEVVSAHSDRLYSMLMQEDEITWQTIIYDLVKSEEMNPWDIDISLLTKKYLETIKKLKETNLFLSGKVILASAILLKIKSDKLLKENIADFDNMLFQQDEIEDLADFTEEQKKLEEVPRLLIKTPLARKRKIALQDLMSALNKALEVNQRRILKRDKGYLAKAELPQTKINIGSLIKNLYSKIKEFFYKNEKITFTKLTNSDKKEDKVATFIPLLHLANQNKVQLSQKEHFGEIEVNLIRKGYY